MGTSFIWKREERRAWLGAAAVAAAAPAAVDR